MKDICWSNWRQMAWSVVHMSYNKINSKCISHLRKWRRVHPLNLFPSPMQMATMVGDDKCSWRNQWMPVVIRGATRWSEFLSVYFNQILFSWCQLRFFLWVSWTFQWQVNVWQVNVCFSDRSIDVFLHQKCHLWKATDKQIIYFEYVSVYLLTFCNFCIHSH